MAENSNGLEPVTISDVAVSSTARPWGKGWLALCATFGFPGLGHWIAGKRLRGSLWFVTVLAGELAAFLLVVPKLALLAVITIPVVFLVALCMFVDAFRCGRRSAKPMLGRAFNRYAIGVAILGVTFFFHPWASFSSFLAQNILVRYVKTFSISSGSMMPTLAPGDRVLAHKPDVLNRWNLVVYQSPSDDRFYVARIAGLPGETIEIKNDGLMVDGHVLKPPSEAGPYVSYPYAGNRNPKLQGKIGAGCEGNPIKLAKDEYYLLGDRSERSLDARMWETPFPERQLGATPLSKIPYSVSAIYWPPKRWRTFAP